MQKADKNQTPSMLLPASNGRLRGYEEFLRDLKAHIRSAQSKAILSVNRELILLYWRIGRDILRHQKEEGWGAKVIDRLAVDLRHAFPEMRGFSSRNLKYMRVLAEAYPDEKFVQQVVAQIPWGHNVRILDYSALSPRYSVLMRGGWKNVCKLWLEERTPEQLKGEGG